jgi:protease I
VGIAGVCLAQQEQTSRRRRTPRDSALKTIQLPEPMTSSSISLEATLAGQQQVEPPSNQRLGFPDIGQLAWAARSVAAPLAETAPAANQQPQVGMYFILPDGLYLYEPATHGLQQRTNDDVRTAMATSLLNRPDAPTGGCQIILTGSSRDFVPRYGPYAKTVMLLQAGQMAQSIKLQALALGLSYVSIDAVESSVVKRICRLARNTEPLYVAFVGYPASQAVVTTDAQTQTSAGRKALIVAASQGFRDEELFQTKRGLELAAIQTQVASNRVGQMVGVLGNTLEADLLLNKVNVSDFDAVIFVGGPGAVDFFSNRVALNLARQAFAQRKVLAGIGTGPSILANAGVLKGVRATAFLSERANLMQGGANYTGNPVEKDGSVVTATGPLAVNVFVRAILDALGEAR